MSSSGSVPECRGISVTAVHLQGADHRRTPHLRARPRCGGDGSGSLVGLADPDVPDGVVIGRDGRRVTMRATAAQHGIATGSFAPPSASIGVHLDGETDHLGFAFTQFALPGGRRPGARLRLPPGAEPALAARRSGCCSPGSAGATCWLAPARPPARAGDRRRSTARCAGAGTATSTTCRPGSRPRSASSRATRPARCSTRWGDARARRSAAPAARRQPDHVAPVVLDRQRRGVLVPHRGRADDRRQRRRGGRGAGRRRRAGRTPSSWTRGATSTRCLGRSPRSATPRRCRRRG